MASFKAWRIIKEKIDEKLKFSEENITQQCLKLSVLESDIIRIYINQKRRLDEYKAQKEKRYSDLYIKWRTTKSLGNNEMEKIRINTKTEMDLAVSSDVIYYNLALKVQNQQVMVEYLEQYLKTIRNASYNIRAYIDLKKINAGLT